MAGFESQPDAQALAANSTSAQFGSYQAKGLLPAGRVRGAVRQLLAPARLRENLRQQGIRGVVSGKSGGGMFYPGDAKTYAADFVTIFERQHGMVTVLRD